MKLKKIFCALALTGTLASCNMDYYPSDSIEQSQSFSTVSDLSNLVNGLYKLVREGSNGDYSQPMDVQTDLFHATSSYGNNIGSIYSWVVTSDDYYIQYPWQKYYALLANVNNVIANYSSITPSSSELSEYNTYVGEAYFIRAYAYAYLVNLYAKAYSSSASTDLGVPLNLAYNIEEKLARSTIQEVYDQIFSDLAQAESFWSGIDFSSVSTYKNSACRFTPDAIAALQARLYLNMGEWDKAITKADSLISSGSYPLVTTESELSTMWASDQSTEFIMHLYVSADETPNYNWAYLRGYNSSTGTYTPYYVPEQWVYDLYDDADYRKSVYFANFTLALSTGTFTDIYSLNKYPRKTEFSSSGEFYHSPVLFHIAEMYLIVAEAGAQGTQSTLGLQRLNELRTARGLASLSGLTGSTLLSEVQNERVREMIGEGNRLTDLKRWGLGFTRSDAQNADAVVASYINLSVSAGDDKFVWAIPDYDMNLNSNLVQNSGW